MSIPTSVHFQNPHWRIDRSAQLRLKSSRPSPDMDASRDTRPPAAFRPHLRIAKTKGVITRTCCCRSALLPIVFLSAPSPSYLHIMFFARRSVASVRPLLRNQQPRRFASHAAHAEPVNEGVGVRILRGYCFILSFGLYGICSSGFN